MGKKVKLAVAIIADELKRDRAYHETWKANIAMSFKDEAHIYQQRKGSSRLSKEDLHSIANAAADRFLRLLFSQKIDA